jgi:hypothetical protein
MRNAVGEPENDVVSGLGLWVNSAFLEKGSSFEMHFSHAYTSEIRLDANGFIGSHSTFL